MNGVLIKIIIVLVLLLVLAGIIYMAYRSIKKKISDFSTQMFGTSDIMEGIRQQEMQEAMTPKSVAGATRLYLPMIMKDFPDFHFDEMKNRAENVLISFLRSIDAMNPELLTEGTNELRDSLNMRIGMLQNQEQQETFEDIKIHRTELFRYRKAKGRCSVIFQSALESIHFVEKDGKIVSGRNDRREQSRYNVEVIYIQDPDLIENTEDAGLAMNCPNCGAPLPSLGAKKCKYCGSPIVEFNIRTWNFASVEES